MDEYKLGGVEVKDGRHGCNPSSESAGTQFTTNGAPSGFNPTTAPAYYRLRGEQGESETAVRLTSCYHNPMRTWATV